MGDYVNFHDAPKPPKPPKTQLADHEVFNNALMRAQAAGEKPSAELFARIDSEYKKKKEKKAGFPPPRNPLQSALVGAAMGTAAGGIIAPKGKLLKYMLGGAASGGALGGAMGLGQNLGSMTGNVISDGLGMDENGTAAAATQIGARLAGLGGGAYLGMKAHKRINEELEHEDEPKKKEKEAMSLYSFGAKVAVAPQAYNPTAVGPRDSVAAGPLGPQLMRAATLQNTLSSEGTPASKPAPNMGFTPFNARFPRPGARPAPRSHDPSLLPPGHGIIGRPAPAPAGMIKTQSVMSLYSFGAKVAQSACAPCDMPNGPTNKKHMTGASPAVLDASQRSEEIGKPSVTETEHSAAKAKQPEEGVKAARTKRAAPNILSQIGKMFGKAAPVAAKGVAGGADDAARIAGRLGTATNAVGPQSPAYKAIMANRQGKPLTGVAGARPSGQMPAPAIKPLPARSAAPSGDGVIDGTPYAVPNQVVPARPAPIGVERAGRPAPHPMDTKRPTEYDVLPNPGVTRNAAGQVMSSKPQAPIDALTQRTTGYTNGPAPAPGGGGAMSAEQIAQAGQKGRVVNTTTGEVLHPGPQAARPPLAPGVDPRTGVRPGSVAPPVAPPTAPPARGGRPLSQQEIAQGKQFWDGSTSGLRRKTLGLDETANAPHVRGSFDQLSPEQQRAVYEGYAGPSTVKGGSAMAFGVKVAERWAFDRPGMGDSQARAGIYDTASQVGNRIGAMLSGGVAAKGARDTSYNNFPGVDTSSAGMLDFLKNQPTMSSAPRSRYATENVDASVPGAVESFNAQRDRPKMQLDLGKTPAPATKGGPAPVSLLDTLRNLPAALNDTYGKPLYNAITPRNSAGQSGSASPYANAGSGPGGSAPSGKSTIGPPNMLDTVIDSVVAAPGKALTGLNNARFSAGKQLGELYAANKNNRGAVPGYAYGTGPASASAQKAPAAAPAAATDKPAEPSSIANAMKWMSENPGYTAAGGLGAGGLAALLYHMNSQPKKKKREEDDE